MLPNNVSDWIIASQMCRSVSMHRLILTMVLTLTALPAHAGVGGMFAQGRSQFTLVAGSGYAFDNSYFVIGASASYNVLDGLGVGLGIENWSGGTPGMTKYSPFVQYIVYQSTFIQPYVGVFYRHAVVDGHSNLNSAGGKTGIIIESGSNAYISAGFVHETYRDCQATVNRTCSETYPEISLTFGF